MNAFSSTDFWSQVSPHFMDPDRIPYAIVAVLAVSVIGLISGPMAGFAGPFLWQVVDTLIGPLGDRLDRKQRSRTDLVFRGFLMVAIGLFLALIISHVVLLISAEMPFFGMFEVLILTLTVSAGTVWQMLFRLYVALEKQSVGKGAYLTVARTAYKNLSSSDDFGITRTGMGLSARLFDKAMVAPIFWYLLGGLSAVLVYTALAAMAWRFGKDGFTKGFGVMALALERLMGFVPSAFAALLLTLATFSTPSAAIHKGLAAWLGHKNRAPYEQGGWPLSVLAWSLNVSLGGASQDLSGSAIHGAWVGPEGATAKVGHAHLKRAIYISLMAHLLLLASLGGAYLWASGFFV